MRAQRRSAMVFAFLFLAPAAALLLTFRVVPAAGALWHSFTEWDGVAPATYVGGANFARLVGDNTFWRAVLNNLVLVLCVPMWLGVSLVLALLIHQQVPGWRFFRATFFLPSVLSPVIIGTLFSAILRRDGPVNRGLETAGLGALAHDWLAEPATALPTLVMVILWGVFGMGVIVFLAGLSAVPSEILEAARLDGARGWTFVRYIIVPSLRHVIEFWAVNLVVWSFTSLFAFVYVMTGGGPGYATMLVEYQLYLEAFQFNHMGYACALGSALFLMVLGVVLIQIRLMTGGDD